jgi:hypothetical protein
MEEMGLVPHSLGFSKELDVDQEDFRIPIAL